VTALVGIPGSNGTLTVSGKPVIPKAFGTQDGFLFTRLDKPGRVTLRFRPNASR
jgi:hypothetical protein